MGTMQLPQELTAANQEFSRVYPGESGERRPVHVVYGGAQLFKAETCRKLGDLALRSLTEFAPDSDTLAEVTGLLRDIAAKVYPAVIEKLTREPVEDYRIDFEDGYGVRPDAEEDEHARSAALATAKAIEAGALPPFFGIRVKPFNEELKARSYRTLELFLTNLGRVPANFVITLPKITVVEQVRALVGALESWPSVRIELMMETPQALRVLPSLVEACEGRCAAVHFGPYDYTANLGITAAHQKLDHPACDFARSWMQSALAGTGIAIADGPTVVMPVPPHRGEPPHGAKHAENRLAVHKAWKLHYDNVIRSLRNGFYQGWDLHPAQLPMRYAALFAFFLEGLPEASERLRNFVAKAAQATRIGTVFDDAATGQGLLNYFLRAIRCGAIAESAVPELTGLTIEELRTGSFTTIAQRRSAGV
jgi:hypothetical protein